MTFPAGVYYQTPLPPRRTYTVPPESRSGVVYGGADRSYTVGPEVRSFTVPGFVGIQPAVPVVAFTTDGLTGHGALTAVARNSGAALSGHGSLSATAKATKFILTAELSGAGSLTAAFQITRAAALSAAGQLTGAVHASFSRNAAFSGHGSVSALVEGEFARMANLAGVGVLSGGAHATEFVLTAALAGHGSLAATAAQKFSVGVALSGAGHLAGTTYAKFTRSAGLSGVGSPSAATKSIIPVAASLPGHGHLAATATALFTRAAALTGVGSLTALVEEEFTRLPALSGLGHLTATATAKFTRSGSLPGRGALSGAAYASFTSAAAIHGTGVLSATAVSTAIPRSAALHGTGALSCSTVATAPVTFDATGGGADGSSSNPTTWSHTINTNANAVILVVNGLIGGGLQITPTFTAKVGTTSMTQLAAVDYNEPGTNYAAVYIFGLLNPPTGSQTITVTPTANSGSMAGGTINGQTMSYYNVTSFGTTATLGGGGNVSGGTASIANPSFTISSATGQMVVAGFSGWTHVFSAFNHTTRYAPVNNQQLLIGDAPGASTVTLSATAGSDATAGVAQALVNLLVGRVGAYPKSHGVLSGKVNPVALAGHGVLTAVAVAVPKFDAAYGITGYQTTTTPSWTHTATAGSYVVVFVEAQGYGGVPSSPTATYAGNAMTLLASSINNATLGVLMCWGIAGVSGGAQTVAVNLGYNGGNPYFSGGGSVSYTGVASVGAAQVAVGPTGNQGTTPTQTVTWPGAGTVIVQGFGNPFYNQTAQAGGTNRFKDFGSGNSNVSINEAATTTTFTENVADFWSGIAVVLT